ncbi:MAG: protein kinase [Deltaproteobacteria bacterium]|nr:protein kinase [Deltaproteobacteria bacterium]
MTNVLRLQPGTIVGGDYRLKEQLARGGMGAVYRAEQLSTEVDRALKVMHPELLDNAKARDRFKAEARISAKIQSDHVVSVLGAGIDEKLQCPWIAMELIQGPDLAVWLKAHDPVPREDAWELFRQLCHGLAAAHRIGVVHRDLKPQNVLIAPALRADVPFTVKVLDFGIAKLVEDNHSETTAAVGSPLWMAPEQAQRGQLGIPVDLWALGLLTFRLVTGKHFWRTGNLGAVPIKDVLLELLVEPIPTASARSEELKGRPPPPGFDGWFARCVVRDPSQRFKNAQEALDAMTPILGKGLLRGPSRGGLELVPEPSPGPPGDLAATAPARAPSAVSTVNPSDAPTTLAQEPSRAPRALPTSASEPYALPSDAPPPEAATSTTAGVAVGAPEGPGARSPVPFLAGGVGLGLLAVVAGVALTRHPNTSNTPPSPTTPSAAPVVDAASTPHPVSRPWLEALELAPGNGFTCAVTHGRGVACWGQNDSGQLGDGTTEGRLAPTALGQLTDVREVSSGGTHACARLGDGTVRCWGLNEFGQLGDGTRAPRHAPVAVAGLSRVAQVAAGSNHTCARLEDGTVRCWGHNEFGQLGIGSTISHSAPVAVVGVLNAQTLAVRGDHGCVRVLNGSVRCWGRNIHGQLGDGTVFQRVNTVPVLGLLGATSLALGAEHSCALLRDGTARCWGHNHLGQLGAPGAQHQARAVAVAGLSGAVELTAGEAHTCARLGDGTVHCWGANAHGELGDGATTARPHPSAVLGVHGVESVRAGWRHTCARLASRELRCWGEGEHGELGDHAREPRTHAVAVLARGGPPQ